MPSLSSNVQYDFSVWPLTIGSKVRHSVQVLLIPNPSKWNLRHKLSGLNFVLWGGGQLIEVREKIS